MKAALSMMFLLAVAASLHAQPAHRRDTGNMPAAPEQRRAELRSALQSTPQIPGPAAGEPADPMPLRRRLTEEERAALRQQLRQQAGQGASPDSRGNRATAPCGRESAKKTTRSTDDNCY
jgi:hypothetical protein